MHSTTRRHFLQASAAAVAAFVPARALAAQGKSPLYRISLAQWSINQPLRKGTLQHLDFAKIAKGVGIDAIEYVKKGQVCVVDVRVMPGYDAPPGGGSSSPRR